ncbi:MAG: ferredoxin-thioredoxin reductase catalytic domain-containing protein [Methanothrix sp.]|nr:ferredoxin-thioredoxin reductase catalytic domain-containing protein [Methanothrix sp.]
MKEDLTEPTDEDVERLYARLDREAAQAGYHLNPDAEFTKGLLRGLIINERRYGYAACPCRLAAGDREKDLDIVCPCYYRDADLAEHGACYCGLYVSGDVIEGRRRISSIPERRPPLPSVGRQARDTMGSIRLSVPVWRCLVCGYLCGRDEPPEVCPICRAGRERFERFI